MITYVIRPGRYGWSAFEVAPDGSEEFCIAGDLANVVEILKDMGVRSVTLHTTGEGK